MTQGDIGIVVLYASSVLSSAVIHAMLTFFRIHVWGYLMGSAISLVVGPMVFLAVIHIISGPEKFLPIAFFFAVLQTWYVPFLIGAPIHLLAFHIQKSRF